MVDERFVVDWGFEGSSTWCLVCEIFIGGSGFVDLFSGYYVAAVVDNRTELFEGKYVYLEEMAIDLTVAYRGESYVNKVKEDATQLLAFWTCTATIRYISRGYKFENVPVKSDLQRMQRRQNLCLCEMAGVRQ